MSWLDALGWLGSALLIYSVMQARVLRFRVLNLAACVVLIVFNAALGIWPMVAMNIALSVINIWFVVKLVDSRDDHASYAVLEVGGRDAYLRHVLQLHQKDILAFQPDFDWDDADPDNLAFIVQRDDETVGVVLLHVEAGVASVLLDYVTPRYRDFSPGRFLWRSSGVLSGRGISRVITSPTMVGAYYQRLGFSRRADNSYELDL